MICNVPEERNSSTSVDIQSLRWLISISSYMMRLTMRRCSSLGRESSSSYKLCWRPC